MGLRSINPGFGHPVKVPEIEAELSALWRSAAEDPGTQHAVPRSCSLTLLVFVESEEAGQEALNLVPGVARQNPCRAVIMIAQERGAPAGLSAHISTQCNLSMAGEKEVCGEQIVIQALGEAIGGLDQVVIPLMVPGLPVFFWWRAGRFAPKRFLFPILQAANRVLVDSGSFPNPDADLPDFFEVATQLVGATVITDLNWARLTPWRELIARCFDSAESRPYLDRIHEVRIEFDRNSPQAPAYGAQFLLLAGWLASRLGWEPVPDGQGTAARGDLFLFRSVDHLIRVERAVRAGGGAGTGLSVSLMAGGTPSAIFSLAHSSEEGTAQVRVEVSGRPPNAGIVRLRWLDEIDLVNEEIRFAGRDLVYQRVLGMVARMLESIRGPS